MNRFASLVMTVAAANAAAISAAIVLAASSSAVAATWLVRPDGTGDYPTIQAAIDAATGADVIELADGTFTGNGNRDLDFLGKAITVRSRNGSPEACIIDCGGSPGYEHRGFSFQSGEGPGSVLRGITLTGAFRSENAGGVYCWGTSPSFTDCIFADNISWYSGGGVYARECSSHFTRCTFSGNSAQDGGGAVFLFDSAPVFTDCTFDGNESVRYYGGGISCSQSSPLLTDCRFHQNTAQMGGGGIWFYTASSAQMTGCVFTGNSAHRGGAILCFASSPALTRCAFAGNSAFQGGAAWCYECSAPFLECLFVQNDAVSGGAVYSGSAAPHFDRCTLCGNSADLGGGLWCDLSASPVLERTLIVFGIEGEAIGCDASVSSLEPLCCDLFGNAGGDWVGCVSGAPGTDGNIWEDPLLCDPGGGCYSLQECSPCVEGYGCGRIGAFDAGCPCEGGPSEVHATTWTRIKTKFKE